MNPGAQRRMESERKPIPGPSIDVIMTCYNEGAYISAAVESIEHQTRYDLVKQIIIVDDGSRADTLDVLRALELSCPKLKVIYSHGNGLPKARNIASDHCTSDWVGILDGDDMWVEDKLEHQVAKISENPNIGLVYTGVLQFPSDHPNDLQVAHVNDLSISNDLLKDYFLKEGPIIPSTIIVRRDVFESVGRFDSQIKVFEDTEFYGRMADVCAFAYVNRPLLKKRLHLNSITAKRQELMAHHAFVAFKLAARFPRLYPLIPRRLSERARKLGNTSVELGDKVSADMYYSLAVRLSPLSWRALASLWAHRLNLPLAGIKKNVVGRRPRRES